MVLGCVHMLAAIKSDLMGVLVRETLAETIYFRQPVRFLYHS